MNKSIRTFLSAAFALLVLNGGLVLADGVVLTLSGSIAKTNRGPTNAFNDVLFSKLEVEFASAYELKLGDLKKLPQAELKTKYPSWPSEIVVSGPTLKDVLSHVGADGSTVIVRAVDGYAPEFKLSDIDSSKFILAIKANGKFLGMGGRGPVWLVFPPAIYEDQPEDDGGLTWAAIHIEVKQ